MKKEPETSLGSMAEHGVAESETSRTLSLSRRMTLAVAGAGAGLVLAGGVAAACIPWAGQVTVTPDAGNSTTVHGDPGDYDVDTQEDNLDWCDDTEPYAPAEVGPEEDFTITVEPFDGSANCPDNQLKDGTYDVTWDDHEFTDENGDGLYSDDEMVWGCHHNDPGTWDHYLGSFGVAGGGGEATFTAPDYTSAEGEAAGLCLTRDQDDVGNTVPIEPSV